MYIKKNKVIIDKISARCILVLSDWYNNTKGVSDEMKFDESRPIYIQLVEEFKIRISTGEWQAGEKIDSVRNLAKVYQVNPNTIQRALSELEREGLCESRRTAGRFVTDDKKMLKTLSSKAFKSYADDFIEGMDSLEIKKDEALDKLSSYWEDL